MALTASTMPDLGMRAPDFRLPDPRGKTYRLDDFADKKALLVAFICNHCPYVKHLREAIAEFAREYRDRDLAMVAINANDVSKYPEDAPEKMAEEARLMDYVFPYLFDESQKVARAFRAACTPDFFLFDGDRRLVYRGQFDGSRPGNGIEVTGRDLREAVDAVLDGRPVRPQQKPSMGCNIKWKPGNEPD